MTPEEYNDHLTQLYGLVSGDLTKVTIVPAATNLLSSIIARIESGKKSDGSEIGQYSTKPLYANKEQFIRPSAFSARGKRGLIGDRLVSTHVFRQSQQLKLGYKFLAILDKPTKKYKHYTIVKPNYQVRKTMYLPQGYKELRDIQRLQTQYIDFKYSGALLRSYVMAQQGQVVLLGLNSEEQALKRERLEARFGHTFKATDEERTDYINQVNASLARLTRNTLQGISVTATFEDTKGFHY
jgi:hypothetical protein